MRFKLLAGLGVVAVVTAAPAQAYTLDEAAHQYCSVIDYSPTVDGVTWADQIIAGYADDWEQRIKDYALANVCPQHKSLVSWAHSLPAKGFLT